jgi:pimeloyl-ACP methyl ester carboxylesterase
MFKKILVLLLVLALGVVAAYYLYPERLAKWAVRGERAVAGLSRHKADAAGFRIVYLEGGKGEPLLLLHGFGADKDNFTRVAKLLTPRFHVIVPDLPGFGESSKPADASYTIAEQVERVHAFAQVLGLKTVHLGGSSMGGEIAAVYAAKYPAETGSLWLLAPGGVSTAPPSDLALRLQQGGSNPLVASNADEFAAIFQFVMSDPPFVPRRILDVLGQTAIANHDLSLKIFDQIRAAPPLEAQVQGLTTPTRIVWGDKDRALNVGGAQILANLMPRASVLILPGIGHLPMLERPHEVGADYLSFRDGLK